MSSRVQFDGSSLRALPLWDPTLDLDIQPIVFVFRLYRERITQIEAKLSEVRSGKSVEYLQPLEELQVNMKNRMEVGTVLRELRLENIRCKYNAEIIANEQNFQVRESELKIINLTAGSFCIFYKRYIYIYNFRFRVKKICYGTR